MLFEPGGEGVGLAIRQQIHDPAPFQIEEDRAIVTSFAKRPIVYA